MKKQVCIVHLKFCLNIKIDELKQERNKAKALILFVA